jgi:hypothetical protein
MPGGGALALSGELAVIQSCEPGSLTLLLGRVCISAGIEIVLYDRMLLDPLCQ